MNSFDAYLLHGEVTPLFLTEIEHLCNKVYSSYKHYISFETFLDACWDKLLDRSKNFNPELGNSGNFLFSLFKNELIRLNSRYSREVNNEIIDSLVEESSYVNHNRGRELDSLDVDDFVNLADQRGLAIDKDQLFLHQDFSDYHPLISVFQWFKLNGPRRVIWS